MNRLLIGSTALLFLMSTVLGLALKGQLQDNGKLRAELMQRNDEITALKEAARLDEQEAIAGYEAASSACRQSIRAAVNAVRLPKIEVPRYEANGDPNPACPAISLQSIQNANGDNEVPARDQSGNSTGTESPR